MKIILLEKINKLGELGEIITVKNGYAKNFLIPYRKAILATNKNILLQEKISHAQKKHTDTTKIFKNISNTTILIPAESKNNDELYSKIDYTKLIKILKKLNIDIKIKNFTTNFFIKKTGQHKIEINNDNTLQNLYLFIIKTNK